jgi:restriction system protein
MVVGFLSGLGGSLKDFSVQHKVRLTGPDGEFELDALARFEVLGAEFLVLVECKHHRNRIKREAVQVLNDKIRSVSAHKGMFFSTAPYQKGAIEYARSQRIALIQFTEGGPVYEMRNCLVALSQPNCPRRDHDAYWVTLTDHGATVYHSGAPSELSEYLFSA